jgi:hypothetical protein
LRKGLNIAHSLVELVLFFKTAHGMNHRGVISFATKKLSDYQVEKDLVTAKGSNEGI